MTFDLLPVRFEFIAKDTIHFAPGAAGNRLRGAFGMALRSVASPDDYARIFEPAGAGPSGLSDRPRLFVFRVSHLDGQTIQPGDVFHIDVNLFETSNPPLELFARAFESLDARMRLTNKIAAEPISIPLDAPASNISRIRVEFKTPTELKSDGRIIDKPDFAILFARIRDRISTLRALYGAGPLEIDFRALGERAAQVRLTQCEVHLVAASRRSSRTGQTHGIGGFTGVAEYEGALSEFIPYVEAARHTGVGRHCVWGNGEILIMQARPAQTLDDAM